ncbi:pheromone-regulated protein prm10 [Dipsacomyces acuminosporus]|nr:pheromone-regulated protein prm10 [Dipsacomyces acuminosporus]
MGPGSSEQNKEGVRHAPSRTDLVESENESESVGDDSTPSDQTRNSSSNNSLFIASQHKPLQGPTQNADGDGSAKGKIPTKDGSSSAAPDTSDGNIAAENSKTSSYPKRLFDSVISSAVKHIQDIDKAPEEQGRHATMMSNIGHIKFKPDPAAILHTGGFGEMNGNASDLEAAAASDKGKARPGLLSHYLRLMHLDRKGAQSRDSTACNSPRSGSVRRFPGKHSARQSNSHVTGKAARHPGSPRLRSANEGEWLDVNDQQQSAAAPSMSGLSLGLRRRKDRSRQSLRNGSRTSQGSNSNNNRLSLTAASNRASAHKSRAFEHFANMLKGGSKSSTAAASPLSTPLANTPGVPFRHLSEALPWVNSQRQLASACGTPLAQTRRPSISSVTGDVSTVPGLSIDNAPVADALAEIHAIKSNPSFAQFPGTVSERQNIEYAIEVLLLHQRFLVLMAKAMMMYGSPLHHLEDNLTRLAQLLDLEMTASTIPGLILLSFDDSITHTSETKIIRCSNGWDMHRLDQTNQLLRRVVHSKTELRDAIKELEEIMTAPPIYAWYWQVLNWGMISWSLCLLCFGGSWTDSGIAFALGLAAGIMNLAAGKYSGYTNFFEVSVSIFSGILAAAFSKWSCFGATSLSATVVLLPGLVMTTGVIELSSRHMVAGTVRTFYALLLAFIIAYGLLIGAEIYNKIAGNPVLSNAFLDITACHALTKWSWFGTFPISFICISVLINIHWRHWFSVTALAGMSYGVFWLFKFHLGLDDLAPVVASFVLGLVSNIWSKITGQTAYMILLPGEMFLVPGSVGVRGFSSLLTKQGGQGAQLAMQMMTTCLSIMMGLFASTFLVYPKGKQRSAMLTV